MALLSAQEMAAEVKKVDVSTAELLQKQKTVLEEDLLTLGGPVFVGPRDIMANPSPAQSKTT